MQMIPLPADSPARAAFLMDGDYMSPYIRRGELVTVDFTLPAPGQCGLFCVAGRTLVRQYCEDSLGTVYLFVLNRACRDMDLTVPPGTSVTCLGRFLLDKTPPLPLD